MNVKFTRSEQSNLYHSYLVRFWRDTPDLPWRAAAQCVQTGSTLLFGDLESLLAFLQVEFKTDTPAGETAPTAFATSQL